MNHEFQTGAQVIIRFNPHDARAENVVGTVTHFHRGAGHGACDLATVRYKHPQDGGERELPFATYNLDLASADVLLQLAKRHEAEAAKLRRMESELSAQVVPRAVHIGIEAVRFSGLTNMLDRTRVAEIADEMGFPDAAAWVRDNPDLFAKAIFHGIEAAE